MKFKSKHIKGKGRGKLLGFPTINLEIPQNFSLEEGIWAAWVEIKGKKYMGALHFGPVPTFEEEMLSLEVFLIDTKDEDIPALDNAILIIEPVKRLREVKTFSSPNELANQIEKDVHAARETLQPLGLNPRG